MRAVDENTWKWAPVILIYPLPWAIISLIIMFGGQLTLSSAQTICVNYAGTPEKREKRKDKRENRREKREKRERKESE